LIGLAVMGQNCESTPNPHLFFLMDGLLLTNRFYLLRKKVILNMADKGFKVCAYNRTTSKVDDFMANEAKGESGFRFRDGWKFGGVDVCLFPDVPQARTSSVLTLSRSSVPT
jgi:hypothetical protein